jgi:hypothetical protein
MFLDNIDKDFYLHSEACKSKYLYQDIVDMYPDFGMADFWVGGTNDDISIFQEFIPQNDHLVKDVKEWVGDILIQMRLILADCMRALILIGMNLIYKDGKFMKSCN